MGTHSCYIFGAGEHYGARPAPAPGDFLVAADGGFLQLQALGLKADLIVGDFDSLPAPPGDVATLPLPQEKDDTDLLAALRAGYDRGYRLFHIFGGTGGRLDHTLANLQCLAWLAELGARGFLYDRDSVITVMGPGRACFPAVARGLLSAFAVTEEVCGVTEEGLKYPLQNAVLKNTYPMGISNAFTGQESNVSVDAGLLLLIYPQGAAPVFQDRQRLK